MPNEKDRNPWGLYASESPVTDEFITKLRAKLPEYTGTDIDAVSLTHDYEFQLPEEDEHRNSGHQSWVSDPPTRESRRLPPQNPSTPAPNRYRRFKNEEAAR